MKLRLFFVVATSLLAVSCSSTKPVAAQVAPVYQPLKPRPLQNGEDYSPDTPLHFVGISGTEAAYNGITTYRYHKGKPSTVEWNRKSPYYPKVVELHKEAGY
ncbi:MAG TPA: hypothetical protein VEC13_01535 [Candidatus Paceibacterota bacterium]|nr:hypothetical protein [Candidatus Paceibacterota bacterium]